VAWRMIYNGVERESTAAMRRVDVGGVQEPRRRIDRAGAAQPHRQVSGIHPGLPRSSCRTQTHPTGRRSFGIAGLKHSAGPTPQAARPQRPAKIYGGHSQRQVRPPAHHAPRGSLCQIAARSRSSCGGAPSRSSQEAC
jgi:hypothetical protein